MKKYIAIIITIILCGTCLSIYYTDLFKDVSKNLDTDIKKNNILSMMIETKASSGKYQIYESNEWPRDGYVLNTELSKCENGGTLSWDDINKKVVMKGNISDKCYVYFDIYVEPATPVNDYIKNLYTGTQGANGLYYHNSSLTNGAGDNSYRYAGASPNNYVCFGSDEETCPHDNLYRIIGIFNNKVKLIKADYATSTLLGKDGDYMMENSFSNTYKGKNGRAYWYYWSKNANGDSSTTDWNVSLLNKTNLNTNYLNNIGEKWSQMIATSTWEIGQYAVDSVIPSTIKQYESTRKIFSDYTGKVGLMYLSDYLFAASSNNWAKYVYNASDTENDYRSAKDEDWLYLGDYEWMLATKSSNMVFLINTDGFIRSDVITVTESSLRPVFYLSDGVGIVGEHAGSETDPYRLK